MHVDRFDWHRTAGRSSLKRPEFPMPTSIWSKMSATWHSHSVCPRAGDHGFDESDEGSCVGTVRGDMSNCRPVAEFVVGRVHDCWKMR